ncbi:MAG TPA: HNH endonuclease signature motif containing protein, partial [Nocardioides sp.]|nr:HNH endonuclease signature motif containing protein [Nocardioides sp.]
DHRRFDVHLDEIDQHGGVHIDGYLDAADGRDLNDAVARRAKLRGQLGDTDSLDVRRAKAAGELARQDLALDLLIADEETGEVLAQSPGRRVELHVHITDTTLVEQAQGSRDGRCATSSTTEGDCATSSTTGGDGAISSTTAVGRCEELRSPVTVGQIKEWLQVPKTTVIVRPVIDLADCIPVDSYEIPDRHRRAVRLRDHTCRFPNCPKQATKCDLDHQTPHDKGGPTCPCNLVPLCRRHHRAKTFSLWRDVTIQPGHYLWISPNDRHFHVGPEGTRSLDPPRRLDPDDY